MQNPFKLIEVRLNRIESLLIDLKVLEKNKTQKGKLLKTNISKKSKGGKSMT